MAIVSQDPGSGESLARASSLWDNTGLAVRDKLTGSRTIIVSEDQGVGRF